jgi:endo-alpha-1,4-polygalactosaminidase (GH114 family)
VRTSRTLLLCTLALCAGPAALMGCSSPRTHDPVLQPPAAPPPTAPPPPAPPGVGVTPPPGTTPPPGSIPPLPPAVAWWRPAVGGSWQWQLSGQIDLSPAVVVFDLDLFDTSAAQVAALHARGARAICYISVGSWEDWRPDSDQFPADLLGADYDDWPGERWLDIRQIDRLAPVLGARLDLCRLKGFDGVEPDNVDGYDNDTGFAITAADQVRFARWLAQEAHRRGLSIGLKNSKELAASLEPDFDWALLESCYDEGDWCGDLWPFIRAGKAVLMAEYSEDGVDWLAACARARTLHFSPILKHRELDDWVRTCPP